jgi:hypothetical protein
MGSLWDRLRQGLGNAEESPAKEDTARTGTWDDRFKRMELGLYRDMGVNGTWHFYEVKNDKGMYYGVAFSQVDGIGYVRAGLAVLDKPSAETIIGLHKQLTAPLDPRDLIDSDVTLGYVEEENGLVYKIVRRLDSDHFEQGLRKLISMLEQGFDTMQPRS